MIKKPAKMVLPVKWPNPFEYAEWFHACDIVIGSAFKGEVVDPLITEPMTASWVPFILKIKYQRVQGLVIYFVFHKKKS
jgi:hypothetical protein